MESYEKCLFWAVSIRFPLHGWGEPLSKEHAAHEIVLITDGAAGDIRLREWHERLEWKFFKRATHDKVSSGVPAKDLYLWGGKGIRY